MKRHDTVTSEIRRALAILAEPGAVVELRAFKDRTTTSGYFDNHAELADAAGILDDRGNSVYVTLNPPNPALLARGANKVRQYPKALTGDTDVLRRRWLPIDFDPVRPADISAADEEKQAALDRAVEIREFLAGQGWPDPVEADSGNGAHLLYRIDLPNSPEALGLVKGVLEALAFKFSDERVEVDTTTCNASRIWKLYGTTARKGDSTADRPHRLSRLLEAPDSEALVVVSPEQLRVVAALKPEEPKREKNKFSGYGGASGDFDLDAWIREHGVPVRRESSWGRDGYRYILEECPWNGHTDNSCYVVRLGHGPIAAGCQHNSCQGYGWRDLREHYEPGAYERNGQGPYTGAAESGSPDTGEGRGAREEAPWPVLDEAALYGLPGDVVRTFEPHTEADPVAVLANLLCAFGNAAGRGAFARVGSTEHHLKLFAGLVGESSKGRKGESWGPVRALMEGVDPAWSANRVLSGLSSGEGLIYAVRDEVKGTKNGEEVVLDAGEPDKRLLALEGELAGVLKVMVREGNTLSPVIRQAWDGDRLRTLTKNSPTKATGAHISILGHVTKGELLRHMSDTEAANGFANRFLWLMVRRSKQLPFGGDVPQAEIKDLSRRLDGALRFARISRPIRWGESARNAWVEVYGPLSDGKPGLFGAVVGRGEAQTLRLATLYAVLDESEAIEYEHLTAALALWSYAEESARYIFGDATGDPVADDLTEALRAAGNDGLSRTEIRDLFGRHKSADRINGALALLLKQARVRKEQVQTGGRPTERWWYVA